MSKQIHSFDVFDTSLIRIWAYPADVFWETGRRLRPQGLLSLPLTRWVQLRQEAEATSLPGQPDAHVTLADIYDRLAGRLAWDHLQRDRALEIELAVEHEGIRPIPATQQQIASLRQAGTPIVFISDMYLPNDIVAGLLSHHGLRESSDPVYVSAEHQADKRSGALFKKVVGELGVQATDIIHHGDNEQADIAAARQLGLAARELSSGRLNRYEQLIADDAYLPQRIRSLVAGASRLTRLSRPELSREQRLVWDTAASAVAPWMVGFVHWSLEQASHDGISRLYFAARDGQLLHKVAQVLSQQWHYSIDCRYLYTSRYAACLPTLTDSRLRQLNYLFNYPELTLQLVSQWLHLPLTELTERFAALGVSLKADQRLTKDQRVLLRTLCQHTSWRGPLQQAARAAKVAALDYFSQEGFLEPGPRALVDTGWSGGLRSCLAALLDEQQLASEELIGYYFGLADVPGQRRAAPMETFMFDSRQPGRSNYLLADENRWAFIESLLIADHGLTVGYRREGNRMVPDLLEPVAQERPWQITLHQEAVVEWTRQFSAIVQATDIQIADWHRVARVLLGSLYSDPTPAEAAMIGSLRISPDPWDQLPRPIAPKLTSKELAVVADGERLARRPVWVPGSRVRSTARRIERPTGRLQLLLIGGSTVSSPEAAQGFRITVGKPRLLGGSARLPYSSEQFDAVYLRSLSGWRSGAATQRLLAECHRVLRPGGVLRVAAKNIATPAETYVIAWREAARGKQSTANQQHAVRLVALGSALTQPIQATIMRHLAGLSLGAWWRLAMSSPRRRLVHVRRLFGESLFSTPTVAPAELVSAGLTDSHLIGRLLSDAGFAALREQGAETSYLTQWADSYIDADPWGTLRVAGLLYVEGRRPSEENLAAI